MKKLLALLLMLLLLFSCAQAEETELRVRMGGSFGYGVDCNGTLWGWGDNRNGQLGLESRKIIANPVRVAPGIDGKNLLDIQCGNVNTLFLMKDGTVFTCGSNAEGQQGIDAVKDRVLTPVQIPELQNIVQANCGFGHCLALDKDGHVWAWGRNHVGQIGDGTRKNVRTPIMLNLENIVQVSCGGKYSMALDANGVVYGWGEGDYGQLGGKKRNYQLEPVALELGDLKVKAISCGGDTAYFLCENNTVWAMGRNDYCQLGRDDVKGDSAVPVQVQLPTALLIDRVIAYNSHAIALTQDGQAWIWGISSSGQLGLGERPSKSLPVLSHENVLDADVGSLACVLLLEDGSVVATGLNKYAQTGTLYKVYHMVSTWAANGVNLKLGLCVR